MPPRERPICCLHGGRCGIGGRSLVRKEDNGNDQENHEKAEEEEINPHHLHPFGDPAFNFELHFWIVFVVEDG